MAVAITKEDGTGLANANSYADLADANAYLENTGRKSDATWNNANSDAKRSALIVAAQYMDQRYRERYLGVRAEATIDTQALEFPRDDLFAPSGAEIASADIPAEIGNACIEYALVSLGDGIDPDPSYDPSGRSIKRKAVRVEGAVAKETEYDGSPTPTINRRHPAAERVLSRWLTPAPRTLLRA